MDTQILILKESSKPTKQMGCAKHGVLSMPYQQALDIRVHLCRLRGINEPRASSMILPQPGVVSLMSDTISIAFCINREMREGEEADADEALRISLARNIQPLTLVNAYKKRGRTCASILHLNFDF